MRALVLLLAACGPREVPPEDPEAAAPVCEGLSTPAPGTGTWGREVRDAALRPVLVEAFDDADHDVLVDSRSWTWDSDRIAQDTWMRTATTGAVITVTTVHQYDAAGHEIASEGSDPADPTVPVWRRETDWSGDVPVELRYDAGADGTIDTTEVREYDAAGRPIASTVTWGEEPHGGSVWEYADASGRDHVQRIDADGDGGFETEITRTYDADGRLATADTDALADLEGAVHEAWTWDADGRPLSHTSTGYGTLVDRWTYDGRGLLVAYESGWDDGSGADPEITEPSTTTWTCDAGVADAAPIADPTRPLP